MDSTKSLPVAVIGAGPVGQARRRGTLARKRPGTCDFRGGSRRWCRRRAMAPRPAVLAWRFNIKNGGKSQLAAGLMNQLAAESVTVYSAGTKPGKSLNPQAVESLSELGIDITGEHPRPVTDDVLDAVDAVIILGSEAKLEPHEGTLSRFGIRTNLPNAVSKAWNACAWSGMTSSPASGSCMRS